MLKSSLISPKVNTITFYLGDSQFYAYMRCMLLLTTVFIRDRLAHHRHRTGRGRNAVQHAPLLSRSLLSFRKPWKNCYVSEKLQSKC